MACLFCKIIAGEIPSKMVFEDDVTFAFRDINPQAPTHVLVVPRKHIASLAEATAEDEGLLGYLHLIAARIARQSRHARPAGQHGLAPLCLSSTARRWAQCRESWARAAILERCSPASSSKAQCHGHRPCFASALPFPPSLCYLFSFASPNRTAQLNRGSRRTRRRRRGG